MRLARLSTLLVLLAAAPAFAQNPTNIFVNGTAPTVNSGNKDNGTIRVVVATDQPTNSNAWLVSGIVDVSNTAVGNAIAVRCVDTGGTTFESCGGSGGGGSNAAASATGSAVPASAGYTGINVGGTLRGWTGLSLGSQYTATVAIVDASGNQVTSFGGSGGTASNFTSAFPATGTAAGFSDGTNMQGSRVFDGDSGAGTQYILGVGLRKTASGGTVEAGTSSDPLRVDPTGTTAQPVTDNSGSLTVDAPVGTPVFVRLSDGSSAIATLPVSLATLPALPAGANLIGYVGNQWTFGTKTTMTTTNFTSLASNTAANCTTGCWQSGSITTSGARDIIFRLQSKGQAGSTAQADVYVCVSMSSDSTFTGGCSGTEGTYTVANVPNNMRYLGSIAYNGTTAVQASFNLTDVFGTVPGKVALVIKNQSGGTLSTTAGDHVFDYQLVN